MTSLVVPCCLTRKANKKKRKEKRELFAFRACEDYCNRAEKHVEDHLGKHDHGI